MNLTKRHPSNNQILSGSFFMKRVLGTALLTMFSVSIQAQTTNDEENVLEEVVVQGSRVPASVADFPGSLTVINPEDIDAQRALGADIGTILAYEVPGLATASGGVSSFEMSLRGRNISVLIDGVPITAVLRPAGRDLISLDPSAVERIEVIRGASALYGNGGSGGVVNYITKNVNTDGTRFTTDVSAGVSLTHLGDSFRPRILQIIEGQHNSFDYIVTASYEDVPSFWDADGDRIPPAQSYNGGLPDSKIQNYFIKLGNNWGDKRLEASFLYYDQAQDTEYGSVSGSVANRTKTTAALGAIDPRSAPEGTDNTVANIVYSDADVWGSSLRIQGYYQQTDQVFAYLANRFGGSQSYVDSEKKGARLDINTPLQLNDNLNGYVLWGLDFTNDNTLQPLLDGRVFVPALEQDSIAEFAQLNLDLTSWLNVQAGIRNEDMDVKVQDFVSLTTGVAINGGSIDYGATVYNAGTIFHLTETVDVYAAWSQGFSVSDIGVVLRQSSNPNVVTEVAPEAVEYDNYEIGIRLNGDVVSGELVAFKSESDLGTNFVPDPNNVEALIVQRRPEEVTGVEFSVQAVLGEDWRTGGTITYLKGVVDNNQDGDFNDPFEYLDNTRIPPVKVTGYLEYDITDNWNMRAQFLYSGERDKFNDNRTTFGLGAPEEFLTFDLLTSFPVGPGQMSVGIANLFNEDYYGNYALAQNNALRQAKKQGTTATFSYRITY